MIKESKKKNEKSYKKPWENLFSLQKALLSYDTNRMYVHDLSGKKERKKVTWLFPEVSWEGEGECHCLPFVFFTLCLMNILFILSQIHKYVVVF